MSHSAQKHAKGDLPSAFSPLPAEKACLKSDEGFHNHPLAAMQEESVWTTSDEERQKLLEENKDRPPSTEKDQNLGNGYRPKEACVVTIQTEENKQTFNHDLRAAHHSTVASEPSCEPSCNCLGYTLQGGFFLVFLYIIFRDGTLSPPPVTMHPNSFSISNFTVNWEADFTFGCQNCDVEYKTRTYYDHIKVYISYNETEDAFSKVSIEAFDIRPKEQKKVHVKFGNTSSESSQPIVREEIGKDAEWEMLHLTMRLDFLVTCKLWGWAGIMLGEQYDSFCWKLLVGVMPGTEGGRLIHYAPTTCHKYDEY